MHLQKQLVSGVLAGPGSVAVVVQVQTVAENIPALLQRAAFLLHKGNSIKGFIGRMNPQILVNRQFLRGD